MSLLGGGPKLVIHIDSSFLKIYGDFDKPLVLNLTSEIISSQEIVDKEKFIQLLDKFLTENLDLLKKQSAIIAIDDNLIYQKSITVGPDDKPSELAEKFFATVPFDPKKLSKLTLPAGKNLYLFATNKELYETISERLNGVDCEVVAAIPLTVFGGFGKDGNLSPDEIGQILSNSDASKHSNFLLPQVIDVSAADQPPKPEGVVEKAKTEETEAEELFREMGGEGTGNKKIWVVLGGILLILIILAGALYFKLIKLPFLQSNNDQISQPEVITPVVTAVPEEVINSESSDSAKVEATVSGQVDDSKTTLKVQILNGSGISGQANRVRNILTDLGYKDFTLGNSPDAPESTTRVSFSTALDSKLKNELVERLKESLVQVEVKPEAVTNYDVVVVTGEDK